MLNPRSASTMRSDMLAQEQRWLEASKILKDIKDKNPNTVTIICACTSVGKPDLNLVITPTAPAVATTS